jgi:quinol monooxygenase YgiN
MATITRYDGEQVPLIELHLRIQVAQGRREDFFAFLREAIPFYEQPGGIRIRLLEDAADDHRFIEVVEYADEAAYARDQQRVASDPQMQKWLVRWRALLAAPPVVETYRSSGLWPAQHQHGLMSDS